MFPRNFGVLKVYFSDPNQIAENFNRYLCYAVVWISVSGCGLVTQMQIYVFLAWLQTPLSNFVLLLTILFILFAMFSNLMPEIPDWISFPPPAKNAFKRKLFILNLL